MEKLTMAFVNEYIPKEDIEKHQIEETNPQWTIDRERQVFLRMHYFNRQRDGEGAWWEAAMTFKRETYIFRLEYGRGGSQRYSETPYIVEWDITDVRPPIPKKTDQNDIVKLLKEALVAYGEKGMDSYVQDVVVKFNLKIKGD